MKKYSWSGGKAMGAGRKNLKNFLSLQKTSCNFETLDYANRDVF
jgi:hypothetical protein